MKEGWMDKRIVIGLAAVLMACLLTTTVWGQATAQISGTVKDQSGAVLPGVELTLNGRNVQDLVTLTATAVSTGAPRGVLGGGQLYSISGGLSFGTDYTLDGANHLNFAIGSTMTMPFPDATQEFKVESTGLSASKGNSASVAVVTKSGTNELHGDLFEFVRNDLFNATPYFATINPATGNKAHGTLK